MPEKISRRELLHKGGCGVLAGAVGACAAPALRASEASSGVAPVTGVDYYQKLGVAPFINAAGTYTVFSASTMPDEVQAAIALASRQPVNIIELRDAAGEYLAKRLKCEGALVEVSGGEAEVILRHQGIHVRIGRQRRHAEDILCDRAQLGDGKLIVRICNFGIVRRALYAPGIVQRDLAAKAVDEAAEVAVAHGVGPHSGTGAGGPLAAGVRRDVAARHDPAGGFEPPVELLSTRIGRRSRGNAAIGPDDCSAGTGF